VREYKTSNRRGVSKTTARKRETRGRMKEADKMRILESFKNTAKIIKKRTIVLKKVVFRYLLSKIFTPS